MLYSYPACFYKGENSYSVIFPDLNHLATCGDTLDEAIKMGMDCLAGYIYSLKLDGEEIPAPSSLHDIKLDDELSESHDDFINIITVDVEEYAKVHFNKSVKKTLSIPKWLNDKAIENNINFSKLLQKALIKELNLNV